MGKKEKKKNRWKIPTICHNPRRNRIKLAIYDPGLFEYNVHPLQCKVHLIRMSLEGPFFQEVEWFLSLCKKKKRYTHIYTNQERGAKVSYIILEHYLWCVLVYTVSECRLQWACLCLCGVVCVGARAAEWVYSVGIRRVGSRVRLRSMLCCKSNGM